MKDRDILFLCQFFYPEKNSSATLPFDTAKYLADKGYSVDALCGYPKEYTDLQNVPKKETVDGVGIHRIDYLQLDRKKKLSRLVNYFSFTLAVLLRFFSFRKYKCVMVYSNPPVLPLVTVLANIVFGTRFIFVVYDVYPEIAYASGAVKPGSLIDRVMKWLNRSIYKRAAMVVALTDEMREFLLHNRPELSEDRIMTIPNWAHEEGEIPSENEADAVKDGSSGSFVVSYVGNMGTCQEMETLAGAVEQLANEGDFCFRFVGHGNKYKSLVNRLSHYEHVEFSGFLAGDEYLVTMRTSSCYVVSLEKGLRGLCAPSKYYSYLYGGKPIIAVGEDGCYLLQEVEKYEIGYAVATGAWEELVRVLWEMKKQPSVNRSMGNRARELYLECYTKAKALRSYEDTFRNVLKLKH